MSSGRRQDLPKKQEQLRTDTAQRLEAIVEAAERAAESVIDDAEKQARRYLDQARAEAERVSGSRIGELSDLVDSLLSQAASLRREAERLQATLEEARGRIAAGARGAPPERPIPEDLVAEGEEAPPAPDPPRLRAVEGGVSPAVPDPEARSADPAGARLLATQLAVSGSSREEIEARLRNHFEIEDTTAILDAILGPEE